MKNKVLKLFTSPLIAVGMFFLINPTLALFDILPDFIGYLLMYAGVYELIALDERICLASKKLIYLAVISALRLVIALGSIGFDSSTVMLICFSFAICEGVLLFTFLADWFDGFDYLMQRLGAFSALKNQTNTRFISGIFFFTRIALGFLPEIAALFDLRAYFDIDLSPVWKALASYKPFAVLLFGIIVLIMGVYWYANSLKYFKGMYADESFMTNASSRYFEIWQGGRNRETVFKLADACVIGGFVFVLDVTINLVPLLPSFISTLLLFVACLLMHRYEKTEKLWIWAVLAGSAQIAFEYYAANNVNTNVSDMSRVEPSLTVTLSVLGVLYVVFSSLFMKKATEKLCACRLATTELSPKKTWDRIAFSYYIFLTAHAVGFILPIIGGYTLWIKIIFGLTFVIGSIVAWNKSIKTEE